MKSMDIHGHPRISMDIFGFAWPSIDIHGHQTKYMEIHGFLCIPMDISGFLCIPMDIHGYLWISKDISGFPWISMDIYGYHGKCVGGWGAPGRRTLPAGPGLHGRQFGKDVFARGQECLKGFNSIPKELYEDFIWILKDFKWML